MKKLLCPQCKIAAMYVKNEQGERLLVYVLENGEALSPHLFGGASPCARTRHPYVGRLRPDGGVLSGMFVARVAQAAGETVGFPL